jgi:hypothetical protein
MDAKHSNLVAEQQTWVAGMQTISYLIFNLGRHFVPAVSSRLMLRSSIISAHLTQGLFAMSRLECE